MARLLTTSTRVPWRLFPCSKMELGEKSSDKEEVAEVVDGETRLEAIWRQRSSAFEITARVRDHDVDFWYGTVLNKLSRGANRSFKRGKIQLIRVELD